ncbi:hypothetical protein BMS3Abin12_01875 [bacterium BMS3Abin12]|nr:hypothetical protein BMS3Abin12_01875 [bacterium BMS3Abin12]GBE50681.1 hypothetical protein BMS3Bbin13_01625 [bacterium BMS3Bbin13]
MPELRYAAGQGPGRRRHRGEWGERGRERSVLQVTAASMDGSAGPNRRRRNAARKAMRITGTPRVAAE